MLFVIHSVDKPDAHEIRRSTRPEHLDYVSRFETRVGGPLLDDDGAMCGSLTILDVAGLEQAENFVAGDPYVRAGLFERVDIHRFDNIVWPTA